MTSTNVWTTKFAASIDSVAEVIILKVNLPLNYLKNFHNITIYGSSSPPQKWGTEKTADRQPKFIKDI